MQTRLWLASSVTVAIVAAGVFVAGPIVHGQAPQAPGAGAIPDSAAFSRDVQQAVQDALDEAGLRNGPFKVDVHRLVEDATRAAQDAVRDLDVKVFVDDAMQDVPDMAMLGGRPRIGVRTRDVTAEEAKAAGLQGITGAFVSEVPADSVAGKAGLQEKDIIVSVDGETIRSARQLSRVIAESPEGRALQIAYVRGTARNTVTVTPASPAMTWNFSGPAGEGPVIRKFERRVDPAHPDAPPHQFDLLIPPGGPEAGNRQFFYRQGPDGDVRFWTGRGRLGVMVQPVTDQLATYFGVKDGVLVTQVTEGSAAAKAGIKAGDVITAVNAKPVKDTGDIVDALKGIEDGKVIPVELTRDKKVQTISVTLQAPSDTNRDRSVTRRQRFTA
ncbi:putative periplasmic serine endoprotease DegP-like precursor [Luteitalea pratensis]|uniref:Putative periplasmic serine endoprotease DegP-like n=1 Tax=Luteitalea pratensis TaxID=1855912 RepID=A0A143PXK3_LUTPR|nr:PDZ domain-containing protein [Luteitalea pratensis]AMY12903.1 putative periplasmic serine endoprotease DegP-like precursor [Luteitalea pratensis]